MTSRPSATDHEATERGRMDGANYLRKFRSGEQGILIHNRYASNPYAYCDPRYKDYNRGFNDGCELQVYIG